MALSLIFNKWSNDLGNVIPDQLFIQFFSLFGSSKNCPHGSGRSASYDSLARQCRVPVGMAVGGLGCGGGLAG